MFFVRRFMSDFSWNRRLGNEEREFFLVVVIGVIFLMVVFYLLFLFSSKDFLRGEVWSISRIEELVNCG